METARCGVRQGPCRDRRPVRPGVDQGGKWLTSLLESSARGRGPGPAGFLGRWFDCGKMHGLASEHRSSRALGEANRQQEAMREAG